MFRPFIYLSSIATAIVCLFWAAQICFVRQSDLLRYKQFKQKQETVSAQSLSTSAHQSRRMVRKDIWMTESGNIRHQHRIESKASELMLQPVGGSLEVIENLHNVRCWMQEKLYSESSTAMQQLRFMEAAEGVYRYRLQNFEANQVALSLFRVPGAVLPKETDTLRPFLKGNAQDVTFSIKGNTPQFKAHNFRATLQTGGSGT